MTVKILSRTATILLVSALTLLFTTGCSKSDEGEKYVALDMTLQREYVGASKSSQFIEIKCNVGWEITIVDVVTKQPVGWCYMDPENYKGVGSRVISLYYEKNLLTEEREVEITIKSTREESITVVLTQMETGGFDPDPGGNTEVGPIPTLVNWLELLEPKAMDNCKFTTHYTQIDNKKVRNYSLFYDTKEKIAYWVAYPLHSMYLNGVDRKDNWAYDPNFKTSEQAYMKKGMDGGKVYQRGHQVASADRLATLLTNTQTFYYTNMTPQLSGLNGAMWASLEKKVRAWIPPGNDTLYVVTGAILKTVGGDETVQYAKDNNGEDIAVPNYYFKVLLCPSGGDDGYKTVGFWFPHKAATTSEGYFKYAKSVREIEVLTGFNFFDGIPKGVQDAVETTFNRAEWSGL